jgi:hypothetical protein
VQSLSLEYTYISADLLLIKLGTLIGPVTNNFERIACSVTADWWVVTLGQLHTNSVSHVTELHRVKCERFSVTNVTDSMTLSPGSWGSEFVDFSREHPVVLSIILK